MLRELQENTDKQFNEQYKNKMRSSTKRCKKNKNRNVEAKECNA